MTEEVVKFLGGTAIAIAAIGWLVRSLIGHFLSKDVESFKQRLQSESTVELERLRHSLRLIASEREKQVHLLHERRAEVIAELYARLKEFVGAAGSFASLVEWKGETVRKKHPKHYCFLIKDRLQHLDLQKVARHQSSVPSCALCYFFL